MHRIIEVAGDENYVKYTCHGWWCDRCRLRYECFTSNQETELVVYGSLIGDWIADFHYDFDSYRLRVATQMYLFGIETCGFEWYRDKWQDDLDEYIRRGVAW